MVHSQNFNYVLTVQVRFHPLHPHILASGSLDQEVRLWDANTSECIISHHFCMFTYCESLLFFSKLLLLSCNCYYICFCSFSCVYWFLSLMNSLVVSSHRPSHCIYCFSCQRWNNCCCIWPQGSIFSENIPYFLNLWWTVLNFGGIFWGCFYTVVKYYLSCTYGTTTRKVKHPLQYLCWRQSAPFVLCIFTLMPHHIF